MLSRNSESPLGKVVPVGRRADLVSGVTSHHLVNRCCVVEKPVGSVRHRSDHRKTVIQLAQFGKVLRKLDPGDLGADWLEDTLHIVRHVLLWVPKIQVAGASLKVDHDDAFCFSPAWATAFCCITDDILSCCGGLKLHE